MLPLDDPRWQKFSGGYGTAYDAAPVLKLVLAHESAEAAWQVLWEELHHQDTVGQASFAAVPWLVESVRRSAKLDWNALALIAVIELARPANQEVAPELADDYFKAIQSLPEVIGTHPDQQWDETVVRSASACIALARNQRWYAKACFELDRETTAKWFSEEFGWDFDGGKS